MKVFEIRTEETLPRVFKQPIYTCSVSEVIQALRRWLVEDSEGVGTIRIVEMDEEEFEQKRKDSFYELRAWRK